MLETSSALTSVEGASAAAAELVVQLRRGVHGSPDALVVFASPRYDQRALLSELASALTPKTLIGASSAGEFMSARRGEGHAAALAIRSDTMRFSAGLGRGLRQDRVAAARAIAGAFRGKTGDHHLHASALVMTDALAGYAEELVEQLNLATGGRYQFFGGGAGDDANFKSTPVFFGTELYEDAAVALEILSDKPIGIGVGHGWEPASKALRVTEAQGARLVSLDGAPAADVFEEHARATGQTFDRGAPLPFFLHNILGIDTGAGHRLRVPLAVTPEGAVDCAAELAVGSKVHIMRTRTESAVDAATRATKRAVDALHGATPKAAIFFDCVATRFRMGDAFGLELEALAKAIHPASYVGCNTHGQIARSEGQLGGFHNCTAVVCVLPE